MTRRSLVSGVLLACLAAPLSTWGQGLPTSAGHTAVTEPMPLAPSMTPTYAAPSPVPQTGHTRPPAPMDPLQALMTLPDIPNGFTDREDLAFLNQKLLQVNFEYLLWWLRDSNAPPLVTRGSFAADTPGALGEPGTRLLAGGQLDNKSSSGGRISGLFRPSMSSVLGVDGSFFILQQQTGVWDFGSQGRPGSLVIARPFFNVISDSEDADPVALPTIQSGNVSVSVRDRFLGGEANVRLGTPYSGMVTQSFAILAGGRYLSLDERFLIQSTSQELPAGDPGTSDFYFSDDFSAFNRFVGGQVGAEAKFEWGALDLTVMGKIGYGRTYQTVNVRGLTIVTEAGGGRTVDDDQGLLVQPTNAGRYKRESFSFVPELTLNVGFCLTERMRFFVGYNFLYWTNVARGADQIDRRVNVQPLGEPRGVIFPPPSPAFPFKESSFWAQGLNFGLALTF